MCMAIPSRVLSVDGLLAVVDSAGQQRQVNLLLLDEEVTVGDYLLIQHGVYAYERLDAGAAQESLDLIAEVVAASGHSDLRAW